MQHSARLEPELTPDLRLVAWEITRRCNLHCAHCRAGAEDTDYEDELSTSECCSLIDSIAQVANPVLILTGGEPLYRSDIYQIGRYATEKGMRVVLGTNGTLITSDVAARLKAVPVARVGVSIDFPFAELQDEFRGKTGAYAEALRGIDEARAAGLEVQVNTTVTRLNAQYLDSLLTLAIDRGAVAFHPFLLVPTGRGKNLADVELPAEEYERILNWVFDRQVQLRETIAIKPTDAPHYFRIMAQRRKEAGAHLESATPMHSFTRGCLAGVGFCFISHVGRVQGCGYLDVAAGDVRRTDFAEVWRESQLFRSLRDLSGIKGKCGVCEYKRVCGGCRARAFEATGDYLEAEPYCVYQPTSAAGTV